MSGVIKELIKSRKGKASVALVMIYGLLIGYFVWHTFFDYVPKTYPINWEAKWIAYPGEELSQSYFRKKIYLTERVRHAWIKVMAPDSFKVYVNGKVVGIAERVSDNVTEFFDLTPFLQAGTNVLAIATYRSTYPGTSKIVVEGIYEDWQGIKYQILSDESWKVNRFEEWQLSGGAEWSDLEFNDVSWKNARVIGISLPKDNSKVSYNYLMYTEKLHGQWIWTSSLTTQTAYFRYSINLPAKPEDAWIRIAAKQGYHLIINGISIGERQKFIDVAGRMSLYKQNLDIYNIAPFLKAGLNIIAISGIAERSDRGILVDGLVLAHKGNVLWIFSPEGWKTSPLESKRWTSPYFDDSKWLPALINHKITIEERFIKEFINPTPPKNYLIIASIKKGFFILFAGLFVVLLWFLFGILFSKLRGIELVRSFILTSLLYPLPLLFLAVILLIGYDFRYDQSFPFQRNFILASFGFPFLLFIFLFYNKAKTKDSNLIPARHFLNFRHSMVLALCVIVALGFFLRLRDIDYKPLGGDEVTMTLVTQSLLKKGYPAVYLPHALRDKVLTTSEIVPYFMAISFKLFPSKSNEFKIRFPGVFFGTLTILLIYFVGKTLFDKNVGILASLIYATLPLAISMAQFARYPSPLLFFALLTAHLFYRSISPTKINYKYFYFTLGSYILTYFTWEGSAFFVPALFLGLVRVRGKDLTWIKDKHIWLSLIILSLIISFQLSLRYLHHLGILVLGSGISDLTLTPPWKQPIFEPLVYVYNFFALKNILPLSLIAVLGLLLAVRSKPLFYIYALMLVPIILTTFFLEIQSFRHVYYTLPFLVLAASKVFMVGLEYLFNQPKESATHKTLWTLTEFARIGFALLLIFTCNDSVLKLYNMPGINAIMPTRLEYGDDGGIRKIAEFLKHEYSPGDKVISIKPHIDYFYYAMPDYFPETALRIPVLVSVNDPVPVNRLTGSELIYGQAQLNEVLNNNRRVWLVFYKFSPRFIDRPFLKFIRENTLLAYEDHQIWLYLWKR